MKYEELVAKVKAVYEKADASQVGRHVAVQFTMSGDPEGWFYVEVKDDGSVSVMPYTYDDKNVDAFVTAEDVVAIISGKKSVASLFADNGAQGDYEAAEAFDRIVLAPAKKPEAKKTVAKTVTAKTTTAKKTATAKTAAKKSATTKTVAKPAAKKTEETKEAKVKTAAKTAAAKTAAKKTAAAKTASAGAAVKTAAKPAAKKTAAKK